MKKRAKVTLMLDAAARAFATNVSGSPWRSSEVQPMTAATLTRMTISHNAPAIRAVKSGDVSVDMSDAMGGCPGGKCSPPNG
jgi:hypothetical protein